MFRTAAKRTIDVLKGGSSLPATWGRGIVVSQSFFPGSFASSTAAEPKEVPSNQSGAKGLSAVPQLARSLGLAGAIPFIALSPPVASLIPCMPAALVANASLLQIGYGASIASFLGGIHWAMAMAEFGGKELSKKAATERYLWSVTPCLMAWPAVTLEQGPGSLVVAMTLGVVYAVDRSFAGRGLLPSWYMSLRLPLTAAATTGMLMSLIHSFYTFDGKPTPLPPHSEELADAVRT